MSYKHCLYDNIYAIRLLSPTANDVTAFMADIERAYRARGQALGAVISVVPEDMAFPAEDFRKASGNATRRVLQYANCCCAVIEGNGLKASAMRAIAHTIATIAMSPDKTFVESTVERAVQRVAKQLGTPSDVVLSKLREQQVAL